MPTLPPKFGPRNGIDSKDYVLYMQPPGGHITERPVNLLGHSLTSPNQNLTDALLFTEVRQKNGKITTVSRVKRAARETSRTYTVGLPSALWTPVVEQALREGCNATFFLIYQCPEDEIYNHWDILPDASMNPPIEAEDVITTGDDTNIITQQTEIQTPEKLRGFALGWSLIYSAGDNVAINDAQFHEVNCLNCPVGFAQEIIVAGGDGTAIPFVASTEDRFNDPDVLTTGGAAATVGHAVYWKDDFIAVGMLITTTTGSLRISRDNGTTWAAVAGIAEPIRDIINVNGTLIALGGDATNGSVIYFSDDEFANVTTVSSAALPTDQPLNDAAYDETTGKIYFVGGGGTLLVGRFNGNTLLLTDISANHGGVGALSAVCVRGPQEIVIGGASAYLKQSYDGGVTWASLAIAGTDDVTGIAGNQWRLVVVTDASAGAGLFEQTAPTNYKLTQVELADGQTLTGTFLCVTMNLEGDFNRFVAGTTEGEVVMGVPFYPGA